MEEKTTFADLGKMKAIEKLYEGTPYKPFESSWFETAGKGYSTNFSKVFLEGIDFDLTYFPLKHLGYKSVIAVTGELYAEMASPRTLSVRLGISTKLGFDLVKDLWEGIVYAAREHGYSRVSLDLQPSLTGLCIAVSACGETSLLMAKRRPIAKSMDLICISGNLGAAYLGQQVLERRMNLEDYKMLVGSYLKPELKASTLSELESSEIVPSFGYFVTKGLADTLRRLVRDSGLGAKVYVDKLPFAGKSFDLGKTLDIDPISAAMNGGDDYRLLFTIPMGRVDKFRHDFQTYDIIGHLARPEVGAALVTPDGIELPVKAQGWPND